MVLTSEDIKSKKFCLVADELLSKWMVRDDNDISSKCIL